MPQLGETVTEGTIIRWLKQVGEEVAQDEPLFEVSTDKVDSEVPSSAAGVLSAILVEEGATVEVGTKLAVIGGEPAAATPPASGAAPAEPERAAPAEAEQEAPADEHAQPAPAVDTGVLPAASTAAPPSAAPARANSLASGAAGASLLLSPVVRRLIDEHGLDPSAIPGTGQGGRITRGDVLTYLDRQATSGAPPAQPAAPSAAPAARPTAPSVAAPPAAPADRPQPFGPASAGDRDEIVPFNNIRRLTAEHMVRSKATSAHTLVAIEADYEGVERVRRAYKDRFRQEEGIGLTYLPFVARAVVDALREFPLLNASVGDNALIIHRDVHLGIAVDLDRQGLIVPVVRRADGQSLRGLARAMADLAERARSRRLSADDVVGGTFSITNPGPFGTFITAPIISQPQVAILSTDGVKRRPVVVEGPNGGEAIAIHSVGMLALSFDHRAVDGAYASAFLKALAVDIETRDWSAEL